MSIAQFQTDYKMVQPWNMKAFYYCKVQVLMQVMGALFQDTTTNDAGYGSLIASYNY